MDRHFLLYSAVFFLGLAIVSPVYAPPDDRGGRCREAIGISPVSKLGFGAFATTEPGKVVVSPTGSRTADGGIYLMGGTVSAATFDITGCDDWYFTVLLPESTTLASDTASMTVNTFVSRPDGGGELDDDGQARLRVGATLHVGQPQPPGNYNGSFLIEVSYQ